MADEQTELKPARKPRPRTKPPGPAAEPSENGSGFDEASW